MQSTTDPRDPCTEPIEPDLAAAYAAGAVGGAERARLEAHLDRCAECRWLAYGAAVEGGEEGDGAHAARSLPGGALPTAARIGRYLIERPIGAGGMGIVYAALDLELGRRVALKAVRDPAAAGRARLLREAQAMARVAHPNVTPVYDVVESGADLYVAMELVEGQSLEAWLARPRGARAILEAFVAAASGLAAVHAAGLVHGDVKPRNILVGADGRVRVTDLGLARAAHGAVEPCARGAGAGTPAYMAPEQRRGEPATAASDQYSLSLALRDALAGVRGALARRVRPIVERGLREEPGARHASVERLVVALRRAQVPRWRWAALIAVGAALALGAIFAVRTAHAHAAMAACTGEGALDGTWDAATRRTIEQALAATGAPYAGAAWQGVERGLGAWAEAYSGERRAACAATWLDGAQPEAELDARLACLDERRREADALVAVLARADRDTARGAVAAVLLPSPRRCGEPAVRLRPPRRPAGILTALRVDGVRRALAHVKALEDAGRYRDARAAAEAALPVAEATGFAPVIAEAVYWLGAQQLGTAQAGDTLARAAGLADELGDDALRARAWIRILRADYETARGDRIALARAQAAAALVRAQAAPLEWAELHQAAGVVLVDRGELDEGERELRRALELRRAAGAPAAYLAARTQASLGIALAERGDTPAAIDAFRAAAALLEQELGPAHPRVGGAHLVIGQALVANLQPREAIPALERARSLAGDDAAIAGTAATSLGIALGDLGDAAGALVEHERARAIWQAIRPDHPRAALALLGIGRARLALGDPGGARAPLEAALAAPDSSPNDRAAIAFALARALDAVATDPATRARARALGAEAVRLYTASAREPRPRRERDLAVAWLAAHGGPP